MTISKKEQLAKTFEAEAQGLLELATGIRKVSETTLIEILTRGTSSTREQVVAVITDSKTPSNGGLKTTPSGKKYDPTYQARHREEQKKLLARIKELNPATKSVMTTGTKMLKAELARLESKAEKKATR